MGTKINAALSSRLEILITDNAGNTKVCDPVMAVAIRENGAPASVEETNVLQEEGAVRITNGQPGLKAIEVNVNGTKFRAAGLKDGEVRDLDISAAMQPGASNTIIITAHGKPGATADVMIWDGNE